MTANPNVTIPASITPSRYARAIVASKRARWDLERDVLRGRTLQADATYLPSSLTRVERLPFLTYPQRVFFSQVQGRTYAYIFGLVERFINAKVLELTRHHALGDQTALEALIRFSDEEVKHQELFRRIEAQAEAALPPGYEQTADADQIANAVLGMSTWAVLALTLHIELFTQTHYKKSIDPYEEISPLFKDVFKYHWMEESQHAVIDELELVAEDARLTDEERDRAVDDFIALVGAVDGLLVAQAAADARYFESCCGNLSVVQRHRVGATFLEAYRYQYILSGAAETTLVATLSKLLTAAQLGRIEKALAPLMP